MGVLAVAANKNTILGADTIRVLTSAVEAVVILWNLLNLLKPPLLLLEADNLVTRHIRIARRTINHVVTSLPRCIFTVVIIIKSRGVLRLLLPNLVK